MGEDSAADRGRMSWFCAECGGRKASYRSIRCIGCLRAEYERKAKIRHTCPECGGWRVNGARLCFECAYPGAGKLCTTDGCGRPRLCKGMCRRCYAKSRRAPRPTVDELYESKVDRSGGTDACHLWTASVNEFGYGVFGHDGETLAARWAYKRYVGPLAAGEVVRHSCDTPACHNRDHWLKGTQVQNILDAVERGRQHHPRGERNVKAKLTEGQVIAIRSSSLSGPQLAREYGVSVPTINQIKTRGTWKHLP
jgi:hypothetical protein